MAVNYKMSDGTDLDDIFEPHGGGASQTVGYKNSSGQDLGSRYMAYSDGAGNQTASATGYQNSSGTDLSQMFTVLGDVAFISSVQRGKILLNTSGGNYNYSVSHSSVNLSKTFILVSVSFSSATAYTSDISYNILSRSSTGFEFYLRSDAGKGLSGLRIAWEIVEIL